MIFNEEVTEKHQKAPILPLPIEGAFGRVADDVLGPFKPSNRQNRYIIVLSDYSTRWCEAFPVPGIEAFVIARLSVDEIIYDRNASHPLFEIGRVFGFTHQKRGMAYQRNSCIIGLVRTESSNNRLLFIIRYVLKATRRLRSLFMLIE